MAFSWHSISWKGEDIVLMPPTCPTNVSRRTGRASGALPQLASSAVPEAEARVPADPRGKTLGEQTGHPGIRVLRYATVVRPCLIVGMSAAWILFFPASSHRHGTHISPRRKRRAPFREECRPPLWNPQVRQTHVYRC